MILQSREQVKPCARCKTTKSLEEFGWVKPKDRTKRHRNSYCKKCNVIASNEWRKKNPEKIKARGQTWRKSHYRKYGITLEKFEEMTQLQRNLCAICGRPPEGLRLHIDHCHNTGKVRALVCRRCNRGMGLFRDSIGNLENAIAYLRKYGQTE